MIPNQQSKLVLLAKEHDETIVRALKIRGRRLTELVNVTGMNKRTVIRRLKRLQEQGLVMKKGTLYSIDPLEEEILMFNQELLDLISSARDDIIFDLPELRIRSLKQIRKVHEKYGPHIDKANETIKLSTGVFAAPSYPLPALGVLYAGIIFHKYLLMYILEKVTQNQHAVPPISALKKALPRGKQVIGIVIDHNILRKRLDKGYIKELKRINEIESRCRVAQGSETIV